MKPIYSGNSKRPIEFVVEEALNGKKLPIKFIKNTSTGD
ncbi:hypothetical protein [Rodentibacter trehalosifermentans]